MYVGDVIGPESFDSYDGQLYSSVHGGYIIRLEENRVVPIVKFGKECGESGCVNACLRVHNSSLIYKFSNLYIIYYFS